MIFPVIEAEPIVQVNDAILIDLSRTYTTSDEASISLIEIEPDSGSGFIDVTSQKNLQYQYSTEGAKSITVRVTTDGAPVVLTKEINIVTEEDDRLFSSDSDLVEYEPDILEYLKKGKTSFKNIHRSAQDKILKWFDHKRITKEDGSRLDKNSLVDLEEVNDWSRFLTLKIIFQGQSNSTDDFFADKANTYKGMAIKAQNRSQIRLDSDGDGEPDQAATDLRSFNLRRV